MAPCHTLPSHFTSHHSMLIRHIVLLTMLNAMLAMALAVYRDHAHPWDGLQRCQVTAHEERLSCAQGRRGTTGEGKEFVEALARTGGGSGACRRGGAQRGRWKGHSNYTRQAEPTKGRRVEWWRCYAFMGTKLCRKPIGWENQRRQENQALSVRYGEQTPVRVFRLEAYVDGNQTNTFKYD